MYRGHVARPTSKLDESRPAAMNQVSGRGGQCRSGDYAGPGRANIHTEAEVFSLKVLRRSILTVS